jgi:hypothetical protein
VFGLDTKINLIQDKPKEIQKPIQPDNKPIIDIPKEPTTIASQPIENIPVESREYPQNIQNSSIDTTHTMTHQAHTNVESSNFEDVVIDKEPVAGSDRAFASEIEVDNHHIIKELKNSFGHQIDVYVTKNNR